MGPVRARASHSILKRGSFTMRLTVRDYATQFRVDSNWNTRMTKSTSRQCWQANRRKAPNKALETGRGRQADQGGFTSDRNRTLFGRCDTTSDQREEPVQSRQMMKTYTAATKYIADNGIEQVECKDREFWTLISMRAAGITVQRQAPIEASGENSDLTRVMHGSTVYQDVLTGTILPKWLSFARDYTGEAG